ncbi:tetraacyldisaccharide 4'-kinase [Pricia sp. S334]|uniref:Tetraacyldisaccharide 4'-kinase n=1 Tax=Pricia mediterranea TaxID=3076079 RepID=A0ABU3L838_9FLAO|nr:tetraacyldisaccharide 4'-kinase [Pricia sp. S334]MDT7829637.1 tetraacyldisaccharide 4'-kinase [Pricia sp. S334]
MEVLRKLLYPVSLIYALVVRIRNCLFDVGVFKSERFATPTLCIGNLSVGGTGKTPMAEFLISLLKDDMRLALLSRGYRRKSKGFVLADTTSTVGDLGDEPYQIYSKHPEIAVAVDADRRRGIRALEKKVSPDLILLDDAFQHRKVKCGFSILLTAYGNLYVNDRYLPTGSLRDSKREAKRADLIIVTKCPEQSSDSQRQRIVRELNPEVHQHVLFSYLAYGEELKGNSHNVSLDYFRGKNPTLVTGIANPEPLVAHLKGSGLRFEHLRFRDHHDFTENDLDQLRRKEYLITTEKDYVRLNGKVDNLYYLPVAHEFLGDDKNTLSTVLAVFMSQF